VKGTAEDTFAEYDLGTLRVRTTPLGLQLYAPSGLTRSVWLGGVAGCVVYLYSIAVSLGWLELTPWHVTLLRPPALSETPFWLLPLLLGGVSLTLAVGGTQLTLTETGLELRGGWPQPVRHVFPWHELLLTRFWDERTRSREVLYGVRFRFRGATLTVRVANKRAWEVLRERFS